MFATPSRGVGTTTAACRRDAFADWLEANLLFGDGEITRGDVSDSVKDAVPGAGSADIDVFVDDLWSELRSRSDNLGAGTPYDFGRGQIQASATWERVLPLSFMLLISCTHWFTRFREGCNITYSVQGALFERLVVASLQAHFPGWSVYRTGWSSTTAESLSTNIASVAAELRENVANYRVDDVAPQGKDAGLDVMLHQPYDDGRAGPPVFLIQCATGTNWRSKLTTPSISRWQNLIGFAVRPQRGFALPFDVMESDFRSSLYEVEGPIFDRRRILRPLRAGRALLDPSLSTDILSFTQPLVPLLRATLVTE